MSDGAGAATHEHRGLIVRSRLLAALEAPHPAPLTVVTGPAGAGKTVLLSTWAAKRGSGRIRVATLDAAAGQVDGLWARLAPALGADSDERDAPATADELADRALVLAAAGRRGRTLVLDDLHLADSDSTRHVLSRLLAEPSALRIVLASRIDPGLPLHRMRLAGTLAEIRSPDLAFTLDEAGALFEHHAIALSPASLAMLWQRTEGWAAGLRLAALSLAGHDDPEAFVADFAGDDRAVVAYLIDEVLERQPARARELLLATAIVERVSVSLANALTGRDDAAAVLDELVAANAFVIPLDRRGEWYRYHALLADLLRALLARRGPQAVARQHRRAAQWYLARDEPRAALRHCVRAGDWDRATSILADHWIALRGHGGGLLLDDALRAFPRAALAARPYAALVAAVRCLDRDAPGEADSHIADAIAERVRVSGARRGRFARDLALVRIQRATRDGDVATGLRQEAVVSAAGDDDPTRARRAQAVTHLELGRLCVADGDGAAPRHLAAAARLAAGGGDAGLAASADGERAWLHALDGELSDARNAARSAVARDGDDGQHRSGAAALAQALVAAEVGDLQGAVDQLATARAIIDAQPGEHGRLRALDVELVDARIAMLAPPPAAQAACDRLRAALHGWDPPLRVAGLARAQLADLLVRLGRPEEALALTPAVSPRAGGLAIGVARASALLALDRNDEALAEVAPMLDGGDAEVALPCAVTASAVAAGAAEAEGDRGQAQRFAEHALDLAEPEGARLGLAIALDSLDPVLRRLLRVGTAHRSLIGEVLELARSGSTALVDGVAPLHEPLSERELTVLRYLPTLLSSSEIAGELFVTVNTVKSHLKSIYRKLEVGSRRDAVRRARDLGLIASAGLSVGRRAG